MNLRAATINDIPLIANLICETTGHWGEMAFGLGDRQRAEEEMIKFASFENNRFSYKLAHILEIESRPAGLLLSFPGKRLRELEKPLLKQFLGIYGLLDAVRALRWVVPAYLPPDALPDEYHIAHLAVIHAFRRQGIGRKLLEHAEGMARSNGLNKCSLEVGLDNQAARTLYDSYNYKIVGTFASKKNQERYGISGYERRVKVLNE